MLTQQHLHSGWTVQLDPSSGPDAGPPLHGPPEAQHLQNEPIPARVPGCVHTDLLQAGLIVDPFLDDNENAVSWVGRSDWSYRSRVRWDGPPREQVDLVFDGLDTLATVSLDGHEIGRTRNMHRSYRFDVTDRLSPDPADLTVRFASAYSEALALEAELGERFNAYPEPFQFIRKMACSFGWDWGPTLVTAGIWRGVGLEGWSTARLAGVRPFLTVDEPESRNELSDAVPARGRVLIKADLERTPAGAGRELTLRLTVSGHGESTTTESTVPTGATEAELEVAVDQPQLWWPHTLGDQPLYDVLVELVDARSGETLHTWQRASGFRTIELDWSADDRGSRFVFRVNGVDIFARGFNWIPDDIFPSRMTRGRYQHRLGQAVGAGADMIRVWGGGIYESEDFYRACDELGLLVWQDFLFACAAYPEDEPLYSEIVAEARENVARLTPHPSLVLWNGNNENLWLCDDNPWPERTNGVSWGENYYLEVLPAVVAEVDPSRPYTAGSPWSGSWEHPPNDPDHQTFHSWDVWNRQDYQHYRDSVPRFVAEFGWQAPPTWATLRRSVSDDPLTPSSPGVLNHQKAPDGNGKLERGLAPHFGVPTDIDTWHYLTQLNQVRAVRTGIEHWRSRWPDCAGTVIWQLNDLWPVTSWAAIDGDGRLKPLYHAVRELYSDELVTIQPVGDELIGFLINQGAVAVESELIIRRRKVGGDILAETSKQVTVPARGVVSRTLSHVGAIDSPQTEFLTLDYDGHRGLWFGAEGKDVTLEKSSLNVRVRDVDGGTEVTVTAATLTKDLLLQADRIDPLATVDRGFTTLLPGEAATYRVQGAKVTAEDLRAPFVLTCLNDVLQRNGDR